MLQVHYTITVLTHTNPAGLVTTYTYDADGNVLTDTESNGTTYTYDSSTNNVSAETYTNGTQNTLQYNDTDKLERVTGSNGVSMAYSYDENGNATGYILTIGSNSNAYAYTYDSNGNILTISLNGTPEAKYTYNLSNEMTREDNAILNQTIVYTYDSDGNILTKTIYPYTTGNLGTATQTITYQYGNSEDSDLLTGFNGENNISYTSTADNKLLMSYEGTTYTLKNGQQLTDVSSTGSTIHYEYNADGLRTSKTVNGVTTTYTLNGSQLLSQTDDIDTMSFAYDSSGNPATFALNGITYTYEHNLQGDVIGLLDSSNNEVVTYTYDSWGKLVNIGGSLASTVGVKNPLRYRGYYYDLETGLYYLESRYYNPEWGRFISKDDPSNSQNSDVSITSYYQYCENNPVVLTDKSGDISFNATCTLNYDDLDVRGSPDNRAKVIGEVFPHERVQTLETKGEFTRVSYKISKAPYHKEGWVHTRYLSFDKKISVSMQKAKVKIVSINGVQYFDYSSPIDAMVDRNAEQCFHHSGGFIGGGIINTSWFYNQVKSNGPWDIKRSAQWVKQSGAPYPGTVSTKIALNGEVLTPDDVGNITYGYWGSACGYSPTTLFIGGGYAAGGIWGVMQGPPYYGDQPIDHKYIQEGINWFNRDY